MTRVLFCDMNHEHYQEVLSEFTQLVKQLTDWQLDFIDEIDGDANNWLNDVRNKIDASDILISFNGMSFLRVLGSFCDEFQTRIISKIQSGTPLFCKVIESRQTEVNLMDPICKVIGASALYYRVYSDINRPENDPNPYCVTFDKAKSTLRDPELFKKVNSVYGDSSTLINYKAHLYPLIDVESSEYIFVDEGDLFFHGSLGMKNTIAVRGELFDSIQFLYTGRLFENPYTDIMGRLHYGITKNMRLAENVIKCLDSAIGKPVAHETMCYELFSQLERRLGLIIESKLTVKQISEWIDDNCKEASYLRSNLGQLNFSDLVKIICSHWNIFDSSVQLDKEVFRAKCNGINKKERRYLAHPIKAENEGYEFSQDSYRLIDDVLKSILSI
jgi:hypothetical protein